MKAVYVTSPRSKKTGNIFHIYNVEGTPQEIEDYKNSPNFKKYPSIGPAGEIQFITNYISMDDVVEMVKKMDGNYTLDQATFNKDVARLNAVADASAVLADKFADRLADKMVSASSKVRRSSIPFAADADPVAADADPEGTPVVDDNLDNM